MINIFNVWGALYLSLRFFWPHLAVMLAITILLTPISLLRTTSESRGTSVVRWALDRSVAIFAFAALGFVIAYYLAQGITPEGGPNALLPLVAAPLISVITAGIAYLEGQDKAAPSSPRTGIMAFLLSCVLSYQTLYFQNTYLWE